MDNINKKDLIIMKLLHYFVTTLGYTPIILQGADNEIWLENLDEDYRIIRIVSNYIHNEEQMEFDIFKTKRITNKIKRKTLSFNMKVLNIYTDLNNKDLALSDKQIDSIYLKEEKDIKKYPEFLNKFPNIINELNFSEKGMDLFVKITTDIEKYNKQDNEKAEDVFSKKETYVTKTLIFINVFIFLYMLFAKNADIILTNYFVYGPYIKNGEFYRLITGTFLHVDIIHLVFNMYALNIIGSQIESFMGPKKFIIIYLFSGLFGSLLSCVLGTHASIGASGAIFGLLGSLLYFGYHYRIYLGTVIKSQIIPLIVFNLILGFTLSGIDNFAHIGGLIGGFLITMTLGVKYKSTKFEKINGLIVTIISTVFLFLLLFQK